ncbi:MAG: MBL fold metallo-hydrolase [Clostridia bacterium]|nr:MBL fold metallo-hydrolase [Clostridia bacterium]
MEKTTLDIKFLGTCACDFSPRLENEYKDCFDLNERRSSAILINGQYLIDAGMHILDSLRIAEIDSDTVTDIFVTHTHSDHFDAFNIERLAKNRKIPLRVWIREDARVPEIKNAEYKRMTPYVKYEAADGVFITGVLANHDIESAPQHLIAEINGKKLFYGCDGAWFLTETFNYIKGAEYDITVLDATVGDYLGDYRMGEHNSIPMLRVMLPSLKTERIITDKTKVIFSHIAPSLHKPHADIVKAAEEMGAIAAYDGMELSI